MAPRLLGETTLDGLTLLEIEGRHILDDHARLREMLRARAPLAAELFAEPIGNWRSTGAGKVSWYTELPGEAESLGALPSARRQQVEGQLRNLMAMLQPLLADPAGGAALRRALVLPGPDSIKVLDGRVVLTDWGMVRAGTAVPADPLPLSPLAAYLPQAGAPPAQPHVAPRPAVPTAPPPPPPMPMPVATPVRSVWNWWLVPAGIAVAAIFLVLGLWLASRIIGERLAGQPTTVTLFDENAVRAAIDRQKQQNDALERELAERRRALGGNVCQADPAQMPHAGPDHAAAVPPAATPTPPGGEPFRGNLAQLLTQAVVLVVGMQQQGAETGSGFFITPDLIVTNRHVVEGALPGKLFVTGGKLTRATPAQVVATSPTSEIGSLDIALLRVPPVAGVQPLAMSTVANPLDPVVAAGFPGLTMRGDEAFHRLLEGDASAVPSVILTDGRISAIQTSSAGLKIMPHTAAVSGGNSGGPLVDGCGRVVGINTFITADREQVAHNNYAQKTDGLLDFLHANNAAVTVVNDPCVPSAPAAAPGATAPGSAAPGSTPPGSTPPGSAPPGSTPPGSTPPAAAPGAAAPGSAPPAAQDGATPGAPPAGEAPSGPAAPSPPGAGTPAPAGPAPAAPTPPASGAPAAPTPPSR
jgi:S1-C subfamily serine protease